MNETNNARKRLFLIVLDSLGIGALPDAAAYGDAGSNTLRAIAHSPQFHVPFLRDLGLFNIDGVDAGEFTPAPKAAFARLAERSAGKDTTAGHWEIAGVITADSMPTYPTGFPPELMAELSALAGRSVLCGLPYSGTQVLLDYGQAQVADGALIIYTSADSVLQVAAHEDIVPLEELYRICKIFRTHMQGAHGVGRIIARPFVGAYPRYTRTENRHDYALPPPADTALTVLNRNGLSVIGVGKIYDIFAGQDITRTCPTKNNADGMAQTLALAQRDDWHGLCFVNLVDFDMLYGHRNDVDGYAAALSAFDRWLPEFCAALRPQDTVFVTADHGCDPSTPSTDHSREYTPLLAFGGVQPGVNLGTRSSMADIGATVQHCFGLSVQTAGDSFWGLLQR